MMNNCKAITVGFFVVWKNIEFHIIHNYTSCRINYFYFINIFYTKMCIILRFEWQGYVLKKTFKVHCNELGNHKMTFVRELTFFVSIK